jgi:cytoskeletal protein RodZ
MLDLLTVLELVAVALVVVGVLSVIAHFVNQARANSGKTRTAEQPSPLATPEPRATPSAASVTLTKAVVTPSTTDDVSPPSESLLPPLEPVPPVSDAPLPAVEAVPPATKTVARRFPRFAKPGAVPAARLKSAVRLKATRSSKIKRRTRGGGTASGREIAFASVNKAKPALTRRPKRVTQVRCKKITAPARCSGKAVVHRSPRPVLTPA